MIELTTKAQREMEEKWRLEKEAIDILKIVVAEWKSDPTSVQCFDLRVVQRAGEVLERLEKLSYF